ncbi:MAG: glycosyltransferase family 39 protein [Acidobacteria bacterium]|nr:glycosyltransferase family 39 protein [Acidobacteriota bacterium]
MDLLRRARESLLVWLAAAAGSLLFLLLGPYSDYGPAGYLDPWIYTGYFTNFSYLVRHIGPTYYVSRLPWILPGIAAFHLLPPEAASVLLNLLIVTAAAGSLYWAVRWHYGPPAGFLAAVLLATNPYFLSTVCWDYPDGPAIAYAFAALAFAVRPRGAPRRNSALTGVFLALSGLTNMAAGPMILAVAGVALYRRRSWRDSFALCAGAAAAVAALCPVSQLLFGRWTYFYWQVYQTIATFGNHGFLSAMWGSGPGFLLIAYRLFAPVFLLVLAPLCAARAGAGRTNPVLRPAYLALLLCLALYAFQEFVLHGVALRVHYTSSYLLVPAFFVAGALAGECALSRGQAAAIAAFATLLPFLHRELARISSPWTALLLTGAAAAAALLLPRLAPAGCALMAVALFLSPALDSSTGYAWDQSFPVNGRNADVFRHLMTLEARLKASIDPARRARFWFDRDEPLAPFYDSAESLYLWMHADFTAGLASWPDGELRRQLPLNATLVHLTLHPERLAERNRLLASRGIRAANQRSWSMPYRGYTLQVILEDVAYPTPSAP